VRDASGADEDEALASLRILVRGLHGAAATERVTDDRRAFDAEDAQEVAHAVGIGSDGVVGAWLVGGAVPEEVRGDHRMIERQERKEELPGRGAVPDPGDEEK